MKTAADLRELLGRIDHKGYPAYKDTAGQYQFQGFVLSIDHVQGDPFAAPSDVSVKVKGNTAGFPEEYYREDYKRIALQDMINRRFYKAADKFSFQAKGSGKSGLLLVSRPGQEILERSAVRISPEGDIVFRLKVGFPANGRTINARELIKILFTFLPECVEQSLLYRAYRKEEVLRTAELAEDQNCVRKLLKEHKDTAFTRWTKEIISRKKILQIKRKQLNQNLNKNYRERCFILNPKWIENFDKEISNFIRNYKEKYCWKVKLHKPTTFCIMNVDKNYIAQLISELYEMNVKVENGYVGEKFYKEKFMANPQKKIKDNWLEFNIRLTDYSDNFIYAIKNMQIDDLFIIGKEETEDIGKLGKNIEMIEIENLKELEFLLNLRKEV